MLKLVTTLVQKKKLHEFIFLVQVTDRCDNSKTEVTNAMWLKTMINERSWKNWDRSEILDIGLPYWSTELTILFSEKKTSRFLTLYWPEMTLSQKPMKPFAKKENLCVNKRRYKKKKKSVPNLQKNSELAFAQNFLFAVSNCYSYLLSHKLAPTPTGKCQTCPNS